MRPLGAMLCKDSFHSLSWGNKGTEDEKLYPFGLIAGGMSDGSINLWNVDAIIKYERFTHTRFEL